MANMIPDPNKKYITGTGKKISEKDSLNQFTKEMIRLSNSQHGEALDVLKCHLMVEHYLTRYLIKKGKLEDNAKTRNMMFGAKMELFQPEDQRVLFCRLAMIELNKIRNGYVHNLGYKVKKRT